MKSLLIIIIIALIYLMGLQSQHIRQQVIKDIRADVDKVLKADGSAYLSALDLYIYGEGNKKWIKRRAVK